MTLSACRRLAATIPVIALMFPWASNAQVATAESLPEAKNLVLDVGKNVKMELILIDPNSFNMGSDSDNSSADEQPIHNVALTKPFYLGKYEVTQEQWQAVMGNNPSQFKGLKHPVETVTWNDCQRFLKMLSDKSAGRNFFLPTEAQWEYACRAGTTSEYSYGDDADQLGAYAWYEANANSGTHQFGKKLANRWGLHDLHGNVAEWCADWYGPYLAERQTDPVGPREGSMRVVRGGSWVWFEQVLRSSSRDMLNPTTSYNGVGFRVAAEAGRANDDQDQQ